MFYDSDLLETIRHKDTRRYTVIYDGTVLGTVDRIEEAHYLATDYAIGSATARDPTER